MKHDLATPCPECPFRTDIDGYLAPGRCREIAESLFRGGSFPCHKTTVPAEYEDGEEDLVAGPNSQQCAGASIFLQHQGMSTQMERITERLGMNVATLDMDAPVARNLDEMKAVHEGEPEEIETCSVVLGGCTAPAGYAVGGGVVSGEEAAEYVCYECGEPVCGACSRLDSTYTEGKTVRRCGNCTDLEDE